MNSQDIFTIYDYNVDIIMCIDSSSSMASFIEGIKANALSFYQNLVDRVAIEDGTWSASGLRL